jgi:cobalamin biosynthesis protein CbiD
MIPATEELWKEELWKEVERKAESGTIVVIAVTKRSSEGFYNYKTKTLFVIFKDVGVAYEESFIRDISVIEITAGVFQPFSEEEVEKKIKLMRKKGFVVRRITL